MGEGLEKIFAKKAWFDVYQHNLKGVDFNPITKVKVMQSIYHVM